MIIANFSYSQELINTKEITFQVSDTLFLDSLSVVANSIKLFDKNGNPIVADFKFDFEKSLLIFTNKPDIDSIFIQLKTFPINFFKPSKLLDKKDFLISDKEIVINKFGNYTNPTRQTTIFDNNLESRGSIYRGINFGNNQNAVVNSGLNLQLDGKLSPNLNVKAAISDNNIPIQPDGSTQQLQEFDKIFINVYNDKISITAADFELKKPQGYFLNYNKKVQGLEFAVNDNTTLKHKKKLGYFSSISASIAKGKFRRQEFNGIEGNQGPYKLTGENNEMFIIVLAASERVYIDGVMQKRGYDNDYIIDYNLGEITFTPQKPINKDKRIIVEFEYSDKNYTRYLITNSNIINFNKTKFWLNLYNENDNKNQPFEQDLKDSDKQLLKEIGDNLDLALAPSYNYYESFNNNQIRYKITDTLVNGQIFDSIFVYSTNPDNAFYTVAFAFVGAGNGDYKRGINAANGKVFEWISPINDLKQGDYTPYKKIITPKLNQMISLGAESEVNEKTKLNFEIAYSNNDQNSFSKKDSYDDKGFAFKTSIEQKFIETNKQQFGTNINYGFIHKYFQPIENFRQAEFMREWNLETINPTTNENSISGEIFYKNKYINTKYNINEINRWKQYQGLQNALSFNANLGTWKFLSNANYLISNDILYNSRYLKHNFILSKDFKFLTLGIKETTEDNRLKKSANDTLFIKSFSFNQYEAFIETNDSVKYKFNLNYKFRNDKKPKQTQFLNSTNAHDFSFSSEIEPNTNHRLNTTITYRKLNVKDTTLYSGNAENNLLGKIEYTLKMLKGALSSSTYYEIGSGLEQKTEYSYLEVAPGQGVYTWIDYNENGIQELNEFEIAQYNDQACFIRLITPSAQYIKTYSNQLSQTLNINPASKIKSTKKFAKFLSSFSDQFIFSVSQKNTSNKILEYANPFFSNTEGDNLVNLNSSIRNSVAFNRNNPKYGFDYIFISTSNKILLMQGFDQRTNISHSVLLRFNINTKFGVQNKINFSDKKYSSEFFSEKNYNINLKQNELQINFQPNFNHRISLKHNFKLKINEIGKEQLNSNDVGIEYNLSSLKIGTMSAKFNYIFNKYGGEQNNSIAYEMLEGLMPGSNITWSITIQRQLTNGLVLDLNYNARKSENTKIIHTAGVQIRAFF